MKKRCFWLLTVLIAFFLFGCQDNTKIESDEYLLDVHLSPAEIASSADGISFHHTASNSGLVPIQLREILILSAYDTEGHPLVIDGSSYTPSSLEITSQNGQSLLKNISQHQATFVSEYKLAAAYFHKPNVFSQAERISSTCSAGYTLSISESSNFSDAIVRLDVLLLGKPQEYPYADWELLATSSQLLQGSESPAASQITQKSTTLPNFTASQRYHWELDHGDALLKDIGTLQETQILIPATISLTKTADGYMEDPIYGTVYNVVVAGDAFNGHKTLESVTFADGVSVANNAMYAGLNRGMFQNCSALTTVSGIPDTVISMKNTFTGCISMERTPVFPTAVEDLTNCFLRCSSLREVESLPDTLLCMDSTFRECTALPVVPDLPNGVEDLTQCFYKCSSLTEVTALPDSIVDMTGCFCHCTALTAVTDFPASVKNVNACFQGCSNLKTVAALPDGVENLSGCFHSCVSLAEFPDLPDSVTDMSNTFTGCVGLTDVPSWPASIKNLYGCFTGCTNLSSVPQIPNSVTEWALASYHLQETFIGCKTLDSVSVACCSNAISAKDIADHANVIYTVTHNSSGICDGCHYVNGTFDADGLTVTVDNLAPGFFEMLMPWLKTAIPDALKQTCSSIHFVTHWNTSAYAEASGYALYPSGTVYIRCEDVKSSWFVDPNKPESLQAADEYEMEWVKSVVYHELAHCYDTNFSTYHRFANSAEWMSLHKKEGSFFHIPESNYASYDSPLETFARATSRYFCDPEALRTNCPGMYAYLDRHFGSETGS